MEIDMQKVTGDFIDGRIDKAEFNRLNSLQLIASEGYKIMSQETVAYLLELLTGQAPAVMDFEKYLKEINDQREEIAKAFLATHGAEPKDVEIVTYPTKEGGQGWRVRRIEPLINGIPLPIEVVEALRESERALIGADACADPECGSDQCAALQMIHALLPPGENIPTISCAEMRRARREMTELKAPAARPSLSLEQAGLKLEHAIHILNGHKWDDRDDDAVKAEKVRDLLDAFYDRWFTFHEENLTAIDAALPEPLSDMGGTLPAAVAMLAKRAETAEKESEKYRDILAQREEQAAERIAGRRTGTYGHVGDISQVISDLELYQEEIEKIAKAIPIGFLNSKEKVDLEVLASLLGSACANLEPLRNQAVSQGNPNLTTKIKINIIIQAWYASGVSRAMETAAARLAEIAKILNGEAAETIAKPTAQDQREANLRALLDMTLKEWAPIVALCQENHDVFQLNPGDSVCPKILEVVKEYVVKNKPEFTFGDHGTCKICGQFPENHKSALHEFRPGAPA